MIGLIVTALGMFYLFAAGLALRAMLFDRLLDRAVSHSTVEDNAAGPGPRLLFGTFSACIYGAAGLALIIKSELAVWLFTGGLLMQAIYYTSRSLLASSDEVEQGGPPQRVWNAAVISTGALAISAYALRIGILT